MQTDGSTVTALGVAFLSESLLSESLFLLAELSSFIGQTVAYSVHCHTVVSTLDQSIFAAFFAAIEWTDEKPICLAYE